LPGLRQIVELRAHGRGALGGVLAQAATVEAEAGQPRHRQGQAFALGIVLQAAQRKEQMTERGQPRRTRRRNGRPVPPGRLQDRERAVQLQAGVELGREVGGGACFEPGQRGLHRRQPQRHRQRTGAGFGKQHAAQGVMRPAVGRLVEFLRPPVQLARRHVRLADAVGGAEPFMLQRCQGEVSGIRGRIDERQRHALLRLRGQPGFDMAPPGLAGDGRRAHAAR
jgi:hypothetical protein